MNTALHSRLVALLRELSVRTGTFTLASGKTSDFYVDVRQTALHHEGAWLVGRLLLEALHPSVRAVGGLTLGADPVVSSAVALGFAHDRPVNGFIIRKEAKAHGTGRAIEGQGNVPAGTQVCIVEDTTTTGGSLLKAADTARQAGLEIVQCLTVVDREEGATERLAAEGLTLQALVTRTQLIGPPA